ncbi:MAG TPA: hypothetical protein VFR47_27715 [Anaerolineales bacterium]|nr:hypothetical protein [Anaerolineales bacterium]
MASFVIQNESKTVPVQAKPIRAKRSLNMRFVLLMPPILFLGLNSIQLFSNWAIWSETRRLEDLAMQSSADFQNPAPVADHFTGESLSDFWKFSIINGAGRVSRENTWHAASITFEPVLTLHHFLDPDFEQEDTSLFRKPAAGRYNNVSLIGGRGFRPTPTSDVLLTFDSRTSGEFYGTAGVVFQPAGILHEDGLFTGPFDMFGFSVIGEASDLGGMDGPICYLALKAMPVQVGALQVDARAWHSYELRLHWVSKTEWLGILKIDQVEQCQISMPAFGPVEVHVWSDNALANQKPRRWWEVAPALDLKFEDGGEKLFQLDDIQISAEIAETVAISH